MQEAICIASLQGVRFVSGVVDDVMTAHLGKSPGGALVAAADPYSMIRPEAASQIATFAERLFHQVAERRRRSLRALADDDALRAALKAALAARLDDPAFDATADVQTRALTYGLAAQVFADHAGGRLRRLEAMARLCVLEAERGNAPPAYPGGEQSRLDAVWDDALMAALQCDAARMYLDHMGPRSK